MAEPISIHPVKKQGPRAKYIFYAVIMLSMAFTAAVLFFLWFRPAPTEVNVAGSSADLGASSGRALRLQTKLITWLYLDRIVCQNDPRLIRVRQAKAMESDEKGLALSFNQVGMGKGLVREPVLIMIRRIAEHCGTLAEARRHITQTDPGMPFIITVSEAASGQAAVFERVRNQVVERPANQGWIAACNNAQGTNFLTTRLDRILALTSQKSDLQKIMAHAEVLISCNIYSVIFDWRNNRFRLASGTVPAALSPYRQYTLF